nr:hypothetical protein GCM10020063_100040 [Dactylosporangium thailandense]
MTSRFRFISTHRASYGVKRLCRLLAVSRSGFYRWIAAEPGRRDRAAAEDQLAEQIAAVHADSGGSYGSPRVTAELRAQGVRIKRKRVERVMRRRGIAGRHLRCRRRTTVVDLAAMPVTDLLRRDFTATAPDRRWCGDITYLRVGGGWLFLATVIDIATRRLVGWSINTHMRTSLVADALEAAVAARGGRVNGVIFHSDKGSQGEFNRSSQHLHRGGGRWVGTRSWSGCRKGRGGSGRRTGRCGRRCGRRVGLSRHARCSGSSGG